ncbi:SDR family NAD(P)-dependent oxidoreductase [Spirochaetota bacterium]
MRGNAIIIGNSDGIGLAITGELIKRGWKATGFSRSNSPIKVKSYNHVIADVQDKGFSLKLKSVLEKEGPFDLCIYCVGIGEELDLSRMHGEEEIFNVNLIGLVKTVSSILPSMVKKGKGHFIGLSSLADEMLSPEAPSYNASKAGFSNYLEGLSLALNKTNVHITNIRFGFVDTKMTKGDIKPFMMTVDRAVKHILKCMDKKPIRYAAPGIVIPLVKILKWMLRLKTIF